MATPSAAVQDTRAELMDCLKRRNELTVSMRYKCDSQYDNSNRNTFPLVCL